MLILYSEVTYYSLKISLLLSNEESKGIISISGMKCMLFLNSLLAISTVPWKSAMFRTMPLFIVEAYLIGV